MKNDKLVTCSFLSMTFLLTLLCIFFYFGENVMEVCEKLIAIIFVALTAICACLCIGFSKSEKTDCESLYIEDAGLYILYKGKKKNSKICRVQYFNSVDDLIKEKPEITKIHISNDTNIGTQIFKWAKENELEFSIENSNSTIIIKPKNNNEITKPEEN